MAGDHEKGLDGLGETIHFLEDLGVSAIEVGIPFSDPVADGPVIEEAGLRSLAHGTSTQALVETLKPFNRGSAGHHDLLQPPLSVRCGELCQRFGRYSS